MGFHARSTRENSAMKGQECAAGADADALLAQFGGLEIHFEDAEANDSRGLSRRLGLRRRRRRRSSHWTPSASIRSLPRVSDSEYAIHVSSGERANPPQYSNCFSMGTVV